MKKALLFLFIFFAAIGLNPSASAQQVTIKANILSPVVKTGSFFAEYAVSPNLSAQLGYFQSGIKIKETSFDGFGLTPEVRYFFSGQAPSGLYGAGYVRYQNFDLTRQDTQSKGSLTSFGAGGLLGYQLIIGKHFVIDAFAGPGFNAANVNGGNSEKDFNLGTFSGFSPRGGLSVGIAF
ncbi:DUF3575 domain-containing protein [Rufibacter roseus]|uniref:DUF3575 domain-containing protein n=1 Tax=Rufibacter roseus TaxID=1567108 RepID=A0ABW2DJR5_9BACT|nr:DUF3575 domain-containing protein [Rufibacter roseus]